MATLKPTSANINVSRVGWNTTINVAITELSSKMTIKQGKGYVPTEFLRGKDIFAVFLTGFSKTLIYQLADAVDVP